MRIEYERAQRVGRRSLGCGNSGDDRLEKLVYAGTVSSRDFQGSVGVQTEVVFDLAPYLGRIGRRHVDLVDDGNDLEIMLERHVHVRKGLSLDALRGVDQKDRSLAGRNGPGDFVREIHVTRSVDQIQGVVFSVLGRVFQGDGLALYGDAALAFDVHVVEHLILHLAGVYDPGLLDEAIRQSRFAMIDVRYDAKISYESGITHLAML